MYFDSADNIIHASAQVSRPEGEEYSMDSLKLGSPNYNGLRGYNALQRA